MSTDRLAVTPLAASVEARADGRVLLHVEFFADGARKHLSFFVAAHSDLGSRECSAIARNLARRINRDSSLLSPEA